MLAGFVTLFVVVGTLGLLLNILFTQGYMGAAPKGDRAVGLFVPFFITICAGLGLTLASVFCSFRGGSILQLVHTKPFLAGCIAIAITFGVVLAAFMAFVCWCEPGMMGRGKSVIVLLLGWSAGIIGPILLAGGLLCVAWITKESLLANDKAYRALKVLFASLLLIGCIGYALGGVMFYQTMSRQVANRAVAMARQLRAKLPTGTPIEKMLELELASLSPDAPLSSVVTYFPDRSGSIHMNAACRQLLVERALKVPDLDNAMLVTVGSGSFSDREGVAEFLVAVPSETLAANQEAWGLAMRVAIECDADSIACRPAWLTETFDGKDDPFRHVRSLVNATERFNGLPVHTELTKAMQALTNATSALNPDGKLKKLLRLLEKAGYQPVPPTR
jgi:hypothetical protein